MNLKISGQASNSNYKNSGSSEIAVNYNCHDLRDYSGIASELGIKPEQLEYFDMNGEIVSSDEVRSSIDKMHSGLHKEDTKFFCIMLSPSDAEIAAMGNDRSEQLTNGKQFVFDVMDAYAKNFNRDGIDNRHNLVAYAIPNLFKGKKEKKEQLHWHIIVARKDASNKYKLSPLTNHRNTTKGKVTGGFDLIEFDAECEQLFDARFGYKRKVEETFDYCLAQKKGTIEQKDEQAQKLVNQNHPDLKEAVSAFLTHRKAQIAAEAAAQLEQRRRNEFWNDYHSKYRPEYIKLKEACDESFALYKKARDEYGMYSEAVRERYNTLRNIYDQMNVLQAEIQKATSSKEIVKAVSSLIFVMNPIVGILLILLCGILEESDRDSKIEARRELRTQAAAIRDSIVALKAEQTALRQDKTDRLKVYIENKEAKAALQTEINKLKAALDKPLSETNESQRGYKESVETKETLDNTSNASKEHMSVRVSSPAIMQMPATPKLVSPSAVNKTDERKPEQKRAITEPAPVKTMTAVTEKPVAVQSTQANAPAVGQFSQRQEIPFDDSMPVHVQTLHKEEASSVHKQVFNRPEATPNIMPIKEEVQNKVASDSTKDVSGNSQNQQSIPEINKVVWTCELGTKKSRIIQRGDGKYELQTNKSASLSWKKITAFKSYKQLGKDKNSAFLKITRSNGYTEYMNQYGEPLTKQQKRSAGIYVMGM